MNLYRSREDPFSDNFVEFAKTVISWWMSIELKKNEEHIKTLAIQIHSIFPHNAACERTFSILG